MSEIDDEPLVTEEALNAMIALKQMIRIPDRRRAPRLIRIILRGAREIERKACAEVARRGGYQIGEVVPLEDGCDPKDWSIGFNAALNSIAAAIEARGEK